MKEEEIIEFLNKYKDYKCDLREYDSCIECENKVKQAIQGLLDLYEKQQKEIEELKEELITENDIGYKHAIADFYKFYVSKDKIREKIKELSNGTYDAKIILKQLLEEE